MSPLLSRPLALLPLLALLRGAPSHAAPALALDRESVPARFELPERSRAQIADPVPVSGPWRILGTANGIRSWEAPLPVRPRTLFTNSPPKGMVLLHRDDGEASWEGVRPSRYGYGIGGFRKGGSWEFTGEALRVRRPVSAGRPGPDEYAVRYPRAHSREQSLNFAESGLPAEEFVRRSVQVGDATRSGLLLPAPAGAYFDVTVAPGAVLDFSPFLLPSEAADPAFRSDGATLAVRVRQGDQVTTLWSQAVPEKGDPARVRVSLDAWAGENVRLELISNAPSGNTDLDYVFVADPVLFVPEDHPPRLVIVFIDTLRVDHMSLYGYDKPTTPNLDEWAETAAVFEQARSVAPWTLPSARTMMTGQQPEAWGKADTLQALFARQGWATAFLAGNVYLSSNFEMSDGWGLHRCINWPNAEIQVDRALAFLDENADRSALVMLHFMDMHLPYTEPLTWRRTFAGPRPEAFGSDFFLRADVLRAKRSMGQAGMDYLLGRYDNNLGYIDQELARFLETLSEDDTVLIVSDHGEEFWDHGGFEHGHSLYDELLRVPLVVRGPSIEAGRYDVPVSLLDVAPTLAVAGGQDPSGMAGMPLQGAADGSQTAEFAARPLAFGRPLYGLRQWGVLAAGMKYSSGEGAEALFDLGVDAGEQKDLLAASTDRLPHWSAMGAALDRPVCSGFRVVPARSDSTQDLVVEFEVPGGVAWAYAGDDPLMNSAASVEVTGEQVRVLFPGGYRGNREVFVVPELAPESLTPTLSLRISAGATQATMEPTGDLSFDGEGRVLGRATVGKRTLSFGYAVVPAPPPEGDGIGGFDSEMAEELAALGYVDLEAGPSEAGPGMAGGGTGATVVLPERCTLR